MTPSAIETATFRFVAQHLNHLVLKSARNRDTSEFTQILQKSLVCVPHHPPCHTTSTE